MNPYMKAEPALRRLRV